MRHEAARALIRALISPINGEIVFSLLPWSRPKGEPKAKPKGGGAEGRQGKEILGLQFVHPFEHEFPVDGWFLESW